MSETEFIIEPGQQDIIMTRVFDAPPEVVFRVITDPLLIPQWWGPHSLRTRVERMELRPGGLWRFVNIDEDGREYAFHGVYHDIAPFGRFVRTWAFEGAPEDVALETVTLTEREGRTTYVSSSIYPSVEARDEIIRNDGPRGGRESMDRLSTLVGNSQGHPG